MRLLRISLTSLLFASHALAQYPGQPAPPPTTGQPYSPANPSKPYPSRTEQDLKRAEQADSGRGLEWFYIGAEGSFFWLGADTLSKSGSPLLTGGRKASGIGPGGSLFFGGRIYTLNIGARVRTAWLPDSQFLSAGGEIGMRIPKGALEPFFWLGAGYATLLGIHENVNGFNIVLGGGVDYYLSNNFSIGGLASLEMVSLKRPVYQDSPQASATGLAAVGSVVLGLHF